MGPEQMTEQVVLKNNKDIDIIKLHSLRFCKIIICRNKNKFTFKKILVKETKCRNKKNFPDKYSELN